MKEYHFETKEEFWKTHPDTRDGKYTVEDFGIFYYKNGMQHREDGPADEYASGTKYWFINDKFHRLDGPAAENYDGNVFYWIDGECYLKEEYEIAVYLYKNQLENYK